MLRDVSLKRSVATNRVIFLPHCGSWVRSVALLYLINAVMVAFHQDNEVLAACQQVRDIVSAPSQGGAAGEEAVTSLLSFVAMVCFLRELRLYVYVDQLNALLEESAPGVLKDHGLDFPFSFLRSKVVPCWDALGVVVTTAVSANNNVLDEVNHERHDSAWRRGSQSGSHACCSCSGCVPLFRSVTTAQRRSWCFSLVSPRRSFPRI